MFRILLEEGPGEWKIVQAEILLGADAISQARSLSIGTQRAYRVEEYGGDLPEAQEKKHYEMSLDPGHFMTRMSGLG